MKTTILADTYRFTITPFDFGTSMGSVSSAGWQTNMTTPSSCQLVFDAAYQGNHYQNAAPKRENPLLSKIQKLTQQNMHDPDFNVKRLASAAFMSHSQLSRRLKELTTLTPNAFIRQARLEKALELLEKTDMNVSEIAYSVGFNDPNYFTRMFKKEFGKAPTEVRK